MYNRTLMPSPAANSSASPGFGARLFRILRPSHQHSAFSATLLLMASVMASRLLGYLREMYIAWAFGAGHQTDAYFAAFQIPDFLNYILAGGTASITFISIYTRHISRDDNAGAQRAFDSTITLMSGILCIGTVFLEIFAPQLVRLVFPKFSADQVDLCVHLTRILLPSQIFFYAGGIVSAVLLSKRMFLYPALSPALYNIFIILGGVLGAKAFGISSLAYGALAGAVIGPFLINAIGAAQGGLRYRLSFDWHNAGFLEWIRLSIPLMLGVSLVSADDWILRYFASGGVGDISRLNYAKRLFAVPISILGQATGQASMPFFASLWEQGKRKLFADTVNQTVYRISAASFLASAWMMAAALPVIDLAFRHGHFTFADAQETATYFFWFTLSLALWSGQAQYARAFYGAGNTLTPMIASTIIVFASLPVYRTLFHLEGVTGLAIASDIGILMHTVVLAWLLHQKGMVLLTELPWLELMKSLAVAIFAAVVCGLVNQKVLGYERYRVAHTFRADALALLVITGVWLAIVAIGLWVTKSNLLHELRRVKSRATSTRAPEPMSDAS
ncbi:MAG TPA: murein biosynthesis integral membrane protein MurJ [Terriglobales bacterium]|nr:murein biosynthesis integral membrane protein MurJ [Terriglobales bacterium]